MVRPFRTRRDRLGKQLPGRWCGRCQRRQHLTAA